ncbi:MAG: hypothetical protein OXN84_05155 [Albidovulum sp.]|nr:hypothetical protein [Albidovulum sp.]
MQSALAIESVAGAGNDIDFDKEICKGGAGHPSSVIGRPLLGIEFRVNVTDSRDSIPQPVSAAECA